VIDGDAVVLPEMVALAVGLGESVRLPLALGEELGLPLAPELGVALGLGLPLTL